MSGFTPQIISNNFLAISLLLFSICSWTIDQHFFVTSVTKCVSLLGTLDLTHFRLMGRDIVPLVNIVR